MVEPDVHEEAVHVGPEKSRTNQMRQTLEAENKINYRNSSNYREHYGENLAQII